MALRAVVFDYGMVLTGQPDPEAHAAMLRITGLPADRFEALYWADRHAYDEGKLTGIAFWQKIRCATPASTSTPPAVEELNRWDARMWTTQNPAMLAWQLAAQAARHSHRHPLQHGRHRARKHGARIRLALAASMCWSGAISSAWPSPTRPSISTRLKQLGTQPEETLFIDDKPVNVEAARDLGMKGMLFTNVDQLRADLIAQGWTQELPIAR